MGARIAPPFMEATDASRLVCVVVVSYQEYSLTLKASGPGGFDLARKATKQKGVYEKEANSTR